MQLEGVLGPLVVLLALAVFSIWAVRIHLSDQAAGAVTTESSATVLARMRRVRRLDHMLWQFGLAFFATAVGYVILGVLPT